MVQESQFLHQFLHHAVGGRRAAQIERLNPTSGLGNRTGRHTVDRRQRDCTDMTNNDPARTGNAGEYFVGVVVEHDLQWIYRLQIKNDYGIDAHIETTRGRDALGRLIGLQIKTGPKWFKEPVEDGWTFRPEPRHVKYWLNHSLPVLVVLVDLEKKAAWWARVSEDAVESTRKGLKMVVPSDQLLGAKSVPALESLADADPYVLKLRALQTSRSLMELLADGGTITVEVEEWVNKTSGRAEVKLVAMDDSGDVVATRLWPWVIRPFADYAAELPRLFPWADLAVDEETYEEALRDEYQLECGIWDKEDARYYYTADYSGWLSGQLTAGLRPYEVGAEVAHWKVALQLNDLGRAFLALDDLLVDESIWPLG
jgi:hypothetical protein